MGGLENAHIDSGDGECGAGAPSLLVEAERQLAAFHQAVLSLHGPEEAQCAAEDWLHELETTAMHNNPIHWRRISLAAADGLALRLTNGEHPSTHERRWQLMRLQVQRLLQCTHPCEAG